ncbi:MAG: RNA 2',3'-cyclic phosphodiesterase [Puniceicoccaceae bacterium]|nr:MAG: RNA 2',3'-cyclic phosphodiesterase [Puniceicoccaceae bacterium]
MAERRLFFGVGLPEPIRAHLAAWVRPLPGLAWTPPDNLHLTLKFLGQVESGVEERVVATASAITVERFVLGLEGAGVFPPKGKPGVLWVGVGAGHPRLFQLKKRLEDDLIPLGFEPERRIYQPHITLARCSGARPGAIRGLLKNWKDFAGPAWQVDAFQLYESVRREGRIVYEVRAVFHLTKP